MKTTIVALIIALAASLGGEVAQAHEIPRLRGFADVFETSDATCPAQCKPVRGGNQSGCESCPGKPNCIKFNGAGGGAINGNHCCDSLSLHAADGGFTLDKIEKHCHVPGTEKEDKAAPTPEPEPEPTCPAECKPVRGYGGNQSGCESCPGKSNCIKFNAAAGGAINGNHCCDSAALHAAAGGFNSKENIEKHCHVPGSEKKDKAAPPKAEPEPEPTCPAQCKPVRGGNQSGCESCPGKPNCINFNNAAGGTIDGRYCCDSNALHAAAGNFTSKVTIEQHCSIQL